MFDHRLSLLHAAIDMKCLARWSPARHDVAWIVSVGLRPVVVGNAAPPSTSRFGTSCEICHSSRTDVAGIAAHPRRPEGVRAGRILDRRECPDVRRPGRLHQRLSLACMPQRGVDLVLLQRERDPQHRTPEVVLDDRVEVE